MTKNYYKRKVQKIADSTFTISLPKDWAVNVGLVQGSELLINYVENNKLLIEKFSGGIEEKYKDTTIHIDDKTDMENILFPAYYKGLDEIILISKLDFSIEQKKTIRKILSFLVGVTEDLSESKNIMRLKIIVDKDKIDIMRLIRRMTIIIIYSIDDLLKEKGFSEINFYEKELDKNYHIIRRITSLSLQDNSLLRTSNIKNILNISPVISMAKNLELIGDNLYQLSKITFNSQSKIISEILNIFKDEIERTGKSLQSSMDFKEFKKMNNDIKKSLKQNLDSLEKNDTKELLNSIFINLKELQEEVLIFLFNLKNT